MTIIRIAFACKTSYKVDPTHLSVERSCANGPSDKSVIGVRAKIAVLWSLILLAAGMLAHRLSAQEPPRRRRTKAKTSHAATQRRLTQWLVRQGEPESASKSSSPRNSLDRRRSARFGEVFFQPAMNLFVPMAAVLSL